MQPWKKSGGRRHLGDLVPPDSASSLSMPLASTGVAVSTPVSNPTKSNTTPTLSNSQGSSASPSTGKNPERAGPPRTRPYVLVLKLSAAEKARYRVDKRQNGARVAEPEIVEVEESDIGMLLSFSFPLPLSYSLVTVPEVWRCG